MTAEKIYYGLMILAIAVSVLASPFFYARSMRFLSRRWEEKRVKDQIAAEALLKKSRAAESVTAPPAAENENDTPSA